MRLLNSMLKRDTVLPALLAEFPKFAKLTDIEDSTYFILRCFSFYLRDGISGGTIEVDEFDNAFSFFNAMGASDDSEILYLLEVGILEALTEDDETILVAKKKLENQALELFEWTLSIWHPVWYTRR